MRYAAIAALVCALPVLTLRACNGGDDDGDGRPADPQGPPTPAEAYSEVTGGCEAPADDDARIGSATGTRPTR